MNEEIEVGAVLSLIIAAGSLLQNMIRSLSRRWWVRPWILKRDQRGTFRLINEEFESAEDSDSFNNFLRMDKPIFQKLLALVENDIRKESTLMRTSVSAKNRLILTLRFLATGESFQSLQYTFRIGKSTISSIIPEVCKAIYKRLENKYLKVPNTAAEWLNIATEFENVWNFPNTLGAMDGKHILFRAPINEGSIYFNYKQQNSIVLLGLVDARYRFTYIDCGTNGRVSDGGVFQKSTLAHAIERNILNFPEERALPGRNIPVPFVIVADAAFPLKSNIMKPFPFRNMSWCQRIFNYRLSRARRVAENAFGILANRWTLLLSPINLNVEKVQLITQTCCVLHNFLLTECPLMPTEADDAHNFKFCFGLSQQGGNRPKQQATEIRNEFMNYVNEEGSRSMANAFGIGIFCAWF